MPKLELPKADAIVVGSGPNGLAAAIRLAQAGWTVTVLESAPTPGGGVRSAELTLPGFVHDICSSVYPLGASSPFLSTLPLQDHGLQWVFPPASLAHPFDDGSAVLLRSSLAETAAGLGPDGPAYERLIGDLVRRFQDLLPDLLAPVGPPQHPFLMAKLGLHAIRSARGLATSAFKTEKARGFFAGLAAHSLLPLEELSTSAIALVLAASGHAAGWPIARGGAQQLTSALVSYLKSLGGQVLAGCQVDSLDQLPAARAVLLDVTPRQLLKIAGERLPGGYQRKLERYRYGAAAYKMDWALSGPVPWRASECGLAGTVHLGGTLEEISESERRSCQSKSSDRQGSADWTSERPFVLFAQPTLFDPARAPEGKHTAWGYCHVPNGFKGDVTNAIEGQVERFAPGFRDRILARSVMGPVAMERHNANLIGGDISGGSMNLGQLFLRPTRSLYRTPLTGVYLCSSSTPPGAGVHGMCGFWAAERALRRFERKPTTEARIHGEDRKSR
jgi:phytoene dehydrogenase-like protein